MQEPAPKTTHQPRVSHHSSGVPYHDDGDDSHAENGGEPPPDRRVDGYGPPGPVPFGEEVVDGDVNEDTRGEAHGDGEDPVRHPALRGGVDDDADADADGAGDGEREGVGEAGEEGSVREHPEQCDAHGNGSEDLVQADGPQRLPCVSLGLCRLKN